jgi:predicted dehydrogenase
MMGGEHLLTLAHIPGAVAVALADPVEASLEWGRACAGGPVDTYLDHRRLLERDDLDAVIIATPNMTHAALLADVLATNLSLIHI